MARIVDILSIVLFLAAGVAFSLGVAALGDSRDLMALYWLAVGGLMLRAATDIVRPRSGDRG